MRLKSVIGRAIPGSRDVEQLVQASAGKVVQAVIPCRVAKKS
jgi:hypothetical protein